MKGCVQKATPGGNLRPGDIRKRLAAVVADDKARF
jgi:hypothetical protein